VLSWQVVHLLDHAGLTATKILSSPSELQLASLDVTGSGLVSLTSLWVVRMIDRKGGLG
jgi:hypothetical protein